MPTPASARTDLHGMPTSVPNYSKLPSRKNYATKIVTENVFGDWMADIENDKWMPRFQIPFLYDFDLHGGAVTDIDLGITVPKGTIIRGGIIHVVRAPTSAGSATVAFKLQSAGDIMAATAKASLTAGLLKDTVPVNTAATAILLTADRTLYATIGTAALTDGKIRGFLDCSNSLIETTEASSSSSSCSNSSSSSSSSSNSSSPSSSSMSSNSSSSSSVNSSSSSSSSNSSSSSSIN